MSLGKRGKWVVVDWRVGFAVFEVEDECQENEVISDKVACREGVKLSVVTVNSE